MFDLLIPIWFLSFLAGSVAALAQGRAALPWIALAFLTGPLAVAAILLTKSPLSGRKDLRLFSDCFEWIALSDLRCDRCGKEQLKQ